MQPLPRRDFLKQAFFASATLSFSACAVLPAGGSAGRAYRRAGPLIMIDVPGTELDPVTAELIRRHGIRAVLLFQRNIASSEQARALVADLRALIGPQALIATDQEGGGVVRTPDLPFPPSAMSLGASGDPELAREVGAATGRGLAGMGINWNFAPVLDVNTNPLNPVISDRSFGSDPRAVARLGVAWAEGCSRAGVAPCVKHFPGHGDTHVDSHFGLPTVEKDRPRLEAEELLPFRAAAEAGVPCFMTAHIVYPAIDPEHPATLSGSVLNDLLRREWGYEGVIITDSMRMSAIADRYGRGDAAIRALRAGADLVLALGGAEPQERTLEAVEDALADGRLAGDRYAASLRRLDDLAARFPSRSEPYDAERRRADQALMERAWASGLTPYRAPAPPPPGSRVILVVAQGAIGGGASDRGVSGETIRDVFARHYRLQPVLYAPERPLEAQDALRAADRTGARVVFVSTSRHRPDEALKALVAAARPELHVALWNPYTLLDVPAPALLAYGFRPEALEAVSAWLAGRLEARGTLPVTLA